MDLTHRELGPYQIRDRLARGGMSDLYRALHTRLGREVAVKVLPAEYASDPGYLARFRRESRLLASLQHPGIVEVYECDCIDGVNFFAMALQIDPTLESLIGGPAAPGRRLPEARCVAILDSLLDALEAIHAAGVVHRDLKPSNLFVNDFDDVVVSDFGIARGDALTQLTNDGATIGTLLYMAPEQIDGRRVDGRADLYSAGLVLYRMCCGSLPFADQIVEVVRQKALDAQLLSPRQFSSDVSVELERVVLTACRRDVEQRFQTADEFREALQSIPGSAAELASPRRRTTRRRLPIPVAQRGRRRSGAIAAGVLAAFLVMASRACESSRQVAVPSEVRAPTSQGPARVSTASMASAPALPASSRRSAGPILEQEEFSRRMVRLWPGYQPAPVEMVLARLLEADLAGSQDATAAIPGLFDRMLQSIPAGARDRLIQTGFLPGQETPSERGSRGTVWTGRPPNFGGVLRTISSVVQGPTAATPSRPRDPAAPKTSTQLKLAGWCRMWLITVRQSVDLAESLRLRQRVKVSLTLGDLRSFAAYVFLVQSGSYEATGNRVISLLEQTGDPTDRFVGIDLREAYPDVVCDKTRELDRILRRHFASGRGH